MNYGELRTLIEHKKQALAALKQMMHMEKIRVRCGDLGDHYAIWVIWMDQNGKEQTRQFSWRRNEPGHDGLRMQWMWDAFWEYYTVKQAITETYWNKLKQDME